ncbi:MAG: hypothetical protein IPL61_35900 [Myxococcales bacterium]|nr:hypothetical protein [Myxococcales bacterium]
MAGTFQTLRFVGPLGGARSTWPAALFDGIAQHARGRGEVRAIRRLVWRDVHGLAASAWDQLGVQPSDLEVVPSGEALTVEDRADAGGASMREVLTAWPASPWAGVCVELDLWAGPDGFPAIFGACHWFVWWFTDRWCVSAMVEYPTSSVARDPRWTAWIGAFHADAADALGCTPGQRGAGLDVFAP